MPKKSNIEKSILKSMAFIAKKSAQFNADNFCMWWHYQPKMPDAVKKMLLAGEITDLAQVIERLSGYRRLTITEVKNV